MVAPFYPPHVGGIEYYASNLSKHLVSRDHKVTVITTNYKGAHKCPDGIEIVGADTIFLPNWPYKSLGNVGFPLNGGHVIRTTIEKRKIDLVHVNGHHYPITWMAVNESSRLKKPIVLSLHGLYALNPTNRFGLTLEELFNLTIYKKILSKASAVLGQTKTITRYAQKYGPVECKYFTIPNGVEVSRFKGKELRGYYITKYGLPSDKIIVLFRGRFADVKGVRELAQAAKVFTQKHSNVFFVFAGGGPLENELKSLTSSYQRNCRIIDWVREQEIAGLYLASDIFILPSKFEALPITILEAMASHSHIVVTPVGGIPDALSRYPWKTYIREVSTAGIIESLDDALVSFNVKTFGESILVREYVNSFSWEKVSRDIEEVYYTLLPQKETISFQLIDNTENLSPHPKANSTSQRQ